jgi:Ca-activated chloride channel family protein
MIRFSHPVVLYFLLVIPWLVLFFWWAIQQKKKAMQQFGSLSLVQKLASTTSSSKQKWKMALIVMATAFLFFASSGPQIGTRLEEVKREGVDVLIALDVSLSMKAEDIKPSRLEKAKHEIGNFIDQLQGDRIGLLAFAGVPFTQCPLTLDYGAAKLFLDVINTDLIPQPGTAIGDAIRLSLKSFNQKERKYKVLVLITDGEDHDTEPLKAAEDAEKEGVVIYTVGIGLPQGVPIPIYDSYGNRVGFKKDREGSVVTSKLDEVMLEKIALQTGGKYYRASTNEVELTKIYDEIRKMEKKELISKQFAQYEERFQFFLFPGIVLLAFEVLISERKKQKEVWKGRMN